MPDQSSPASAAAGARVPGPERASGPGGAGARGPGTARPLRVVVVTVTHLPEDARIRYRQLRVLLERGHEVTYVAPFSAYGVAPPEGVTAIDVPRSRGVRRTRAVLAAARVLARLTSPTSRAGAADLVLAHDPELLPALLWLQARRPRAAVVWDVHEDVPGQVDQVPSIPRLVRRPLAAAIHAVELVAERRLHLTLAEHGYADRFRGRHPVVPNSTFVPDPRPVAPVEDRLVYVGALTAPRGVEEMVAVAALLPDVEVELIGTPHADVAERLAAAGVGGPGSNVRLRGFVPNAAALERTHGALAGLVLLRPHTNYRHSQFTKIQEYMAHGVPTITTANEAARDLVEAAGSGIVVDHGDVEAVAAGVAAAVRRLQADPALRERLAADGYAAARRDHDWAVDGAAFVDQLEAWAAEAARR